MFNKKITKAFTLLELIVVIVVLGILAMLDVPTFNTVKEKSADSVANKNASAVQRDYNAQAALAQSDPSIVPSATGAWVINGTSYSYTAPAGNTGQNVVASKASGGSGGGGTVIESGSINNMQFTYGRDANWNVDISTMMVSFYNGGSTIGAVGDYFTLTNLTLKSGCSSSYSCIDQSLLSLFENQPLLITTKANSMGAVYSFEFSNAQLNALQNMDAYAQLFAVEGTFTITR